MLKCLSVAYVMGEDMTGEPEGRVDLARAEAGLAVVGEWATAGPEQQRRAADAALRAWQEAPWPPGLLAHACLLDTDGRGILHWSQWTGEDASAAFAGTGRARWITAVDRAAPGIRHRGARGYRRYRSTTAPARQVRPRCLVTVTAEFDGPDRRRQREWVDGVFAAGGTEPSPADGLIAAHFHLSTDGLRVLNLAEWTSQQAHREAAARPGPKVRTATRDFPGVTRLTVRRFVPYGTAGPGTAGPGTAGR